MKREEKTVAAMIDIYCRGVHGTPRGLCDECDQLVRYATQRLERCAFQEAKPTCARCPIHCYKPHRREQIKDVMRFAGPRMLFRHPALALSHILDGRPPRKRGAPGTHRHRLAPSGTQGGREPTPGQATGTGGTGWPPTKRGDWPPTEHRDCRSEETHSKVHARTKESES
ncbi:nitrous oxide-stimulated promoter family protein [Chloroflexota bacterium]